MKIRISIASLQRRPTEQSLAPAGLSEPTRVAPRSSRPSDPLASRSAFSTARIHLAARQRGFTLIELLIATLIFATIMLAINAVYYGAARLSTRAFKIAEEELSIAQAIELMKQDFRCALAPGGPLAGTFQIDAQNMMYNGSIRLEFNTASGAARYDQPWGDVQKVAYYLADPIVASDPDHTGKELVRAVTRNLLPSVEEQPVEQWLMGGVESLRFLFYDGSQWTDTWESTSAQTPLPKAVKVRIDFNQANANSSARPPLEFTSALLAQAASTNTTTGGVTNSSTGSSNNPPNPPSGGAGASPTTGGGPPSGTGSNAGGNAGGSRGGGRTGGAR